MHDFFTMADLGHARQDAWVMASPTISQSSACSPSLGVPGVLRCWTRIAEKNSGRCKRKEEVTGSEKNAEESPWIHAGSYLNKGSSVWWEPWCWGLGIKVLLLHLPLFLLFLPVLTLILHPMFQLLKALNGSDAVRLLDSEAPQCF